MKAKVWVYADHVFDGQNVCENTAVGFENRFVTDIVSVKHWPAGVHVQRTPGILTPGYLDLQVNGGGGALVNNDPTAQAMETIASAHLRFGTVGIMPTVITDAPSVLDRAVNAVVQCKGKSGILGLHIEGPHISLARRGTHAAEYIRPLDAVTLAHIAHLRAHGIAVMITLAPEMVQRGQIAQIVAMGAVVSIGHSEATTGQLAQALAEGASCFTHLFNAMSPMLGRAPGVTGVAINSSAYCSFICDGHHVSDEMLCLAIRARPDADRMVLVSDAMATVGGPDQFTLYGQNIRLAEGRLINADGRLAGAHTTMAEGVARLIRHSNIPLQAALRMAVSAPAAVIGKPDLATLIGRNFNDLVVLGKNLMPQPLQLGGT